MSLSAIRNLPQLRAQLLASKRAIMIPAGVRTRRPALSFDGVDDYVEVPDSASLDFVNEFTIVALVKLLSYAGNPNLISKSGFVSYEPYRFELTRYTTTLWIASDSSTRDNLTVYTPLPLGDIKHVAVTFKDGEANFYHDAQHIGTDTSSITSIYTSDKQLYIAQRSEGHNLLYGNIYYVALFNRVLSDEEISGIYNGKLIIHDMDGLVAYWRFDEGSGTVAHDYSGNENDGTIHGATWITINAPRR